MPWGWNQAPTRMRHIAPSGPHRYQYCLEQVPEDDGELPSLKITAYGDLDCDGVKSTFQRIAIARGDRKQTAGCKVNARAFLVEKETE